MAKGMNVSDVDTKEFFINFLNTEIDQLREESKTPGWTIWAIIAALASVIWLMILEIENNSFDQDQVFLLFLLVYFVGFVTKIIYQTFKPRRSIKRVRYSLVGELFSTQGISLFYSILNWILVIVLAYHFSSKVDKFTYYSVYMCYGIIIVMPILMWGFSKVMRYFLQMDLYIPYPEKDSNVVGTLQKYLGTKESHSKKNRPFYYGVYTTRLLLPILIFLGSYWIVSFGLFYIKAYGSVITSTSVSSFKIAILAYSVIRLIGLLISGDLLSPTLKNLIEIRRDLIFENISLDVARNLTELALYGLSKSAVVEAKFSKSITTLQRIDVELNQAITKNAAAAKLLSEIKDKHTDDVKVLWVPIRDSTFSHFSEARKTYVSDDNFHEGSVRRSLRIFEMFEPDNKDYYSLLDKIEALYKQVKNKYDSTIWSWLNLINEFEGEENALSWREVAIGDLEAEVPDKFGNKSEA